MQLKYTENSVCAACSILSTPRRSKVFIVDPVPVSQLQARACTNIPARSWHGDVVLSYSPLAVSSALRRRAPACPMKTSRCVAACAYERARGVYMLAHAETGSAGV
ncbi:hypothetical protein FA95DRAFT_903781 [Auriscalpium vulgare]|uniref:Uncharacterized protein n=1 Tax=Auriscalpium vulgare TaxID=40419 RepID=A0ACB8R885_9AGAM|nr:hypothetical protein FA95DRAFT_903781 [Auriscalpium vulgare]